MLLWNSWSTAFRRPWCFVHIGGLGWGGVGAGINVHVNLLGKYSRLCVYRSWRSLKEFLPAHMVLKHKDRGHSTMHPSVTICVHVVLALHLGHSRSPTVPGRTPTVAVEKKDISRCQLEVRSDFWFQHHLLV